MMAHSTKWFKLNIIIIRPDLTLGAVHKLHKVDWVSGWSVKAFLLQILVYAMSLVK